MQRILAQPLREAINHLRNHGYAVLKNFISPEVCDAAVNEIDRIVDGFEPTPQTTAVFDSAESNYRLNRYFLQSVDKARCIFEPKAFVGGKLVVPKRLAINKIAHALHEHHKIFDDITQTKGVLEICQELGLPDPLIIQSKAILKPPKIGGEVTTHQDTCYMLSQPDTLLGFWIPLQDATTSNGCLWGIPGSHNFPLYRRVKIVDGQPINQQLARVDYKEEDMVPIEMERGSLAVFTGRFVHKSEDNLSDKSRYAFTWHMINSGSKWCPHNTLQRTQFPRYIKAQ